MMFRRTFLKFAAVCIIHSAFRWAVAPSHIWLEGGQLCTWTGSGEWQDPSNWKDGRLPRNGDSILIPCNKTLVADMSNMYLDTVTICKDATLDFRGSDGLTVTDIWID